ncbi:T9SS type A sorting domain-containing protein [candidate division KSB1 bacterium]|nr:T9SS type A sorting domain-containing protein [candidate division KSB1 bacterium]
MKKLQSSGVVILLVLLSFVFLMGETLNAQQFADSTALFVVADAANPVAAETQVVTRLQDMGFDIELVDHYNANDSDADGKSLVLISSTVYSGTLYGNMPGLDGLEIPVINWEPFIVDEFGFQAEAGGELNPTDQINIILEDHPLAAGLPAGLTTITTTLKPLSYAEPQGDVEIIAVNPDSAHQAVLFCYEKGAQMYTGVAPARRVGLFLFNTTADSLTEDGWALFDASVIWAMGADEPNTVDDLALEAPIQFMLYENYPNPFNPTTTISYSIPEKVHVNINIYNMLGEHVITLVNRQETAGNHSVLWNALDKLGNRVTSGLYICKIDAGIFKKSHQMLLLK